MKVKVLPGVDYPSIADIVRKQTVAVPNFPHEPVVFIDIMPIFANPKTNSLACRAVSELYHPDDYDAIVALEARGWPLAQQVSLLQNKPWYPIRKPGKLPRETLRQEYDCEYGVGVLEMHALDIAPGSRVLIVDDVIATGGSTVAATKLLEQAGAQAVGVATLYSLDYLVKPEIYDICEVRSVVHYTEPPEAT